MTDMANNSGASLRSTRRAGRIDLRYVGLFVLVAGLGGVAAIYPIVWLGGLGLVVGLGLCWALFRFLRRIGLSLWQVVAVVNLSGYIVLNYGYDNLALHLGGFPILLAYGMMYGSFALAVYENWGTAKKILREPAMLCVLALLGLTLVHLVSDIPAYGSWAFRDCTMCLDGVFLLAGMLWAKKTDSQAFLAKWLLILFAANMFYVFTMPWSEKIWSWSPESGAFYPVPLFGNFRGAGDWLLVGAMFCICLGSYVFSRPKWLMTLLVLGQFLGIAITQVRRMYLGIVVVILILVAVGEIKKFGKLLIQVPIAIAVLALATTVGGLQISGRVGPVNLEFFKDHIRSLTGAEDTPGSDPQTRLIMGRQALQHFYAHPIFGEGFGQPVVEVMDEETGTVTRTPHNSTICYLARLGSLGFIFWIAFHFCLCSTFVQAYRQRRSYDRQTYMFILWFFLFYVLFMMSSLVESPFEYPAKAIPFYFLMGLALGIMRWHLSPKAKQELRLTPLPVDERAYR